MSASRRLKRWFDKKLGMERTEPRTPPPEAPLCPVGSSEPIEDGSDFVTQAVSDAVTHVCFRKTTRRLNRPSIKRTTRRRKKDYILKKDPITRRFTRVDLKDIAGSKSDVFYNDAGQLIDN